MAYNITLTNGQTLVNIADGTYDANYSSLNLFGKNYAGYGPLLNENFVKLLENFAFTSPPANAVQGQLWWDSNNKLLKIRKEQDWKIVSGPTASALPPTTDTIGDLWWNTDFKQLNVFTGAEWDVIGPIYTASQGVCGPVVSTAVSSVDGSEHTIVKFEINGEVVGVVSKDATFNTNSVTGLTMLKPGFNLPPNQLYNGNSENALSLGGVLAGNYIRSDVDSATQNSFSILSNNGLNVGVNDDLTINVQNNAVNLKGNTPGRDIDFYANLAGISTLALRINGTTGMVTVAGDPLVSTGVATKNYVDSVIATAGLAWLKADGTTPIKGDLAPNLGNTYSLGNSTNYFAEMHSNNFIGSNVIAEAGSFNVVEINMTPALPTSATTKGYVDNAIQVLSNDLTLVHQTSISNLLGGAPGNLSTLGQLASAVNNNPTFAIDALTLIGNKAPLVSPSLTGNPQCPTAADGDASSQISSTAFVNTAVNNKGTEIYNVLHSTYAPITNPQFLGTSVTAPTPADSDSSQRIATTAYVNSVANAKDLALGTSVTNAINASVAATYAPKQNPVLTGNPQSPTATAGDSSSSIATTSFVSTAVTNKGTEIYAALSAGYAPITNPHFLGTSVTAPTPADSDSSQRIATTAYVNSVADAKDAVVSSTLTTAFNTLVTSTYAPLVSPHFTGSPQGPTVTAGDATNNLATTAFVSTAVADKGTEIAALLGTTYAPKASPILTGTPTAPNPAGSDNSTQIATTSFVNATANAKVAAATTFIMGSINTSVAATYAPIANPHFTGSPTAPTTSSFDNSTNLATTAFVTTAVSNKANDISLLLGTTYAPIANPHFTGTPTAPTAALADHSTQVATTQHVTDKIVEAMTGASATNNLRINNPVFTGTLTTGSATVATGLQITGGGISTTTASTLDIGSASNGFRNIYGRAMQANYADLAENYIADAQYEPGTVLMFGGDQEVTLSSEQGTHKVAGVVSTNPAYLMNTDAVGQFIVPIALQGRCPVKVFGPIKKGDLLVSSTEGYARSKHQPTIGTVIGKALENFDGPIGVIEVAVGRC